MKNPLDSITGTIVAGVVLTAVILYATASGASDAYMGLVRFFHVIAGVAWIGLLYYFNFVQVLLSRLLRQMEVVLGSQNM